MPRPSTRRGALPPSEASPETSCAGKAGARSGTRIARGNFNGLLYVPPTGPWAAASLHKETGMNMNVKELTLDLLVRYGFQVLGAMAILAVGFIAAKWLGGLADQRFQKQQMEPP